MEIESLIIIAVVCALILSYIKTKEKFYNISKPPKGWIQHKGWRIRINR